MNAFFVLLLIWIAPALVLLPILVWVAFRRSQSGRSQKAREHLGLSE